MDGIYPPVSSDLSNTVCLNALEILVERYLREVVTFSGDFHFNQLKQERKLRELLLILKGRA